MQKFTPLSALVFFLFSFGNISAQNYCETAGAYCIAPNGFSGTLPDTFDNQIFPGCPANVLNNPIWYAFAAGAQSMSLLIAPLNCPGTNGQFGMQAAVYGDCNGTLLAAQCGCTTEPFVLDIEGYAAGQTLYLVLDGCAADLCDFTVTALNGDLFPPFPDVELIDGPSAVPVFLNNFNTVHTAIGTGAASSFSWSIQPPGAGSFTGPATGETVEMAWEIPSAPSTAQLCVVPSHACITGLQTCLTVSLDTVLILSDYSALITTEAPPVQLDSALIDLCLGDTLYLTGITLADDSTVLDDSNFTYTWIFDGNETLEGRTVAFAFAEPGFHQVEMTVAIPPGFETTAPAIENIFVIGTPAVTVEGLPSGPVCQGTEITLATGPASDTIVFSKTLSFVENYPDGLPLPDGTGAFIETPIDIFGNDPGDLLTSVDNLRICVNMEHSWMRDLEIKITCPSGQSAILHNHPGQVGGEVLLGEPDESDEGFPVPIPGIGYDYCWTANAPNPTWIEYANANLPGTLPPGDYSPFEPLTNLLGCPLDGSWVLTFSDLWSIDNGHVFSAGITIENIDTQVFIVNASPVWQPHPSITSYSAESITALPDSSATFQLEVTDNFGCGYGLDFPVEVLPEGDPACFPCDSLTVGLEDVLLDCSTVFPLTVEALVSVSGIFMQHTWLFNGDTVSTTPEVAIEMPGEYVFTATNTATGCSVSDTLNFNIVNDAPIADAGPDQVILCQPVTLDGAASSSGPNFAYEWVDVTGAPISNEITATVSEPGVYYLIVTDLTNGCEDQDLVVVTEDAAIEPVDGTTPDSCGLGVGTAFVFFPFGDASYLWSTGDTASAIDGLFSGDYSVTVTWQDCDWIMQIFVDSIACTAATERLPGLAEVKISPNPNRGRFSLDLVLDEMMALEFSVVDVLGREVRRLAPAEHFSAGQHSLPFDVSGLEDGSYFLKIKSGNGQGFWKFVKME